MRAATITFSLNEGKELLKSWAIVSIVFAIAFAGFGNSFFYALLIAGATAGVGFLLHELAHKYTANYFGCSAEYKSHNMFLGFSLIIAIIFQAIFIAPGAVFVRGVQNKRENGIISAAGPGTNIVLALLFLFGMLQTQGTIALICTYGMIINAWLALFNMIPIFPFDGRKVWVWNKPIYILMAALSIGLVFGMEVFL